MKSEIRRILGKVIIAIFAAVVTCAWGSSALAQQAEPADAEPASVTESEQPQAAPAPATEVPAVLEEEDKEESADIEQEVVSTSEKLDFFDLSRGDLTMGPVIYFGVGPVYNSTTGEYIDDMQSRDKTGGHHNSEYSMPEFGVGYRTRDKKELLFSVNSWALRNEQYYHVGGSRIREKDNFRVSSYFFTYSWARYGFGDRLAFTFGPQAGIASIFYRHKVSDDNGQVFDDLGREELDTTVFPGAMVSVSWVDAQMALGARVHLQGHAVVSESGNYSSVSLIVSLFDLPGHAWMACFKGTGRRERESDR